MMTATLSHTWIPPLVIGIDFGTSRSGFAVAFPGPDETFEVHTHTKWPKSPVEFYKTLTTYSIAGRAPPAQNLSSEHGDTRHANYIAI